MGIIKAFLKRKIKRMRQKLFDIQKRLKFVNEDIETCKSFIEENEPRYKKHETSEQEGFMLDYYRSTLPSLEIEKKELEAQMEKSVKAISKVYEKFFGKKNYEAIKPTEKEPEETK